MMCKNLSTSCGFQLIVSYQYDRQARGDDEAFKTLVLQLVRYGLRHFVDEQQWIALLDALRSIQAKSQQFSNLYGLHQGAGELEDALTMLFGSDTHKAAVLVERELSCRHDGKLTGQAVAIA